LSAYFGPVESVTAFATCQIPDLKTKTDIELKVIPPDLTVACLKFKSGVVARLTSSWLAPSDHSIRMFGDTGVLTTDDVSIPRSPVYISRYRNIRIGPKTITIPWKERYPMASPPRRASATEATRTIIRSPRALVRRLRARLLNRRMKVDFCLGPAEIATALRESRPCRLSPEYCLHNTEIVLAIHNSLETGSTHAITTSFAPMKPMPWARAKIAGS
jgi:predicted dehydrogenase